ncbi:MAG: hypothetical protein DRP85_04600 [Candidatus Makaraimicrobium thalassicum]|nr:MAG: hypothetical protein DRP85_04600 [Candidatus Omnitrophota bacterium]
MKIFYKNSPLLSTYHIIKTLQNFYMASAVTSAISNPASEMAYKNGVYTKKSRLFGLPFLLFS